MIREETEEIKRHFGVVAEGLRSEIRLFADGQVGLRQEFGGMRQEFQEFREEMRDFRQQVAGEFKEVRALIRFSYAELDERLKGGERDVLLLKTRLDQIERGQG